MHTDTDTISAIEHVITDCNRLFKEAFRLHTASPHENSIRVLEGSAARLAVCASALIESIEKEFAVAVAASQFYEAGMELKRSAAKVADSRLAASGISTGMSAAFLGDYVLESDTD